MEAVIKNDLPDRFGSMLVKEMRQNMRRGSFVFPFLAVHALAVAAVIIEFQTGAQDHFSENVGMFNPVVLFDSGPLWIVITIICGIIMPLGGLVLMGQELEEGNHELLLLTKLSRWKVVRGKFFSLWSLSVLTLVSLIPYVMVRYNLGGVELTRDMANALSVLGFSAIMSAGAIGASSFAGLGARIMVTFLFLGSVAACTAIAVGATATKGDEAGIFWHINAIAAAVAFTMMGLGLARSRLRLVVHAYEVKPSFMVIGLLFFAPFVVAMTTAMTFFYGGFVGLIGMGLVAIYADVTPKAPAWVRIPQANTPGVGHAPPQAGMPQLAQAQPSEASHDSPVTGETDPQLPTAPQPATAPPPMPPHIDEIGSTKKDT